MQVGLDMLAIFDVWCADSFRSAGNIGVLFGVQVALDLLATVVRASSLPLSDAIMSTFLPAVHCVMKTDDNATMQVTSLTAQLFPFPVPECCCCSGLIINYTR